MSATRLLIYAITAAVLPLACLGQDDANRSVEGRLLEILKRRGIITNDEFSELRELESDLRKESDIEAQLAPRIDEMVARLVDHPLEAFYRQGVGFVLHAPNHKHALAIGGALQVRATYEAREDKNGFQNAEDLQNINTQRAVLWFKGYAFDPDLKYIIQLAVGGDTSKPFDSLGTGFDGGETSANRLVELEYGYVDWKICSKKPWYNLRAGEFKVPYSREWLTPYLDLQFVDRSPLSTTFAPQSSYGVMFWGTRGGDDDKFLEYYAGIFDGATTLGVAEGENIINNDNGMLYAGRLVVNPFGGVPYSEADLRPCKERKKFLLAVGVDGWYHQDNNRSATLGNFDQWAVGLDVSAKWRGFAFYGEVDYLNSAQANIRPDVEATGWNAQLGYMIVPQKLEIGLRYTEAAWTGTTGVTPPTVPIRQADREYLGVIGYYFHAHEMKLQFDFGRVQTHEAPGDTGPSSASIDEWRGRMQFQIIF